MKRLLSKIDKLSQSLKIVVESNELQAQLISMRDDCFSTVAAHKLIVAAGNGGSASQAEHFVAELTGRYLVERGGIPAITLGSNLAELTAIANDYGYANSFLRNCKTFDEHIGTYIFLTTSGMSENITRILDVVDRYKYWIFTSEKCEVANDRFIKVPSNYTPVIQELHLVILHWLAEEIENKFYGSCK